MIRSTLSSWREYLTPIKNESTFKDSGEITPAEFVEAGDYLVYKFPTWQWSPAAATKKRDFLPDNKQFLVTRHVPSLKRAGDFADFEDVKEVEGEEDWTTTVKSTVATTKFQETPIDIEDLIDETAEDSADPPHMGVDPHLRHYDLYITYSTSYRVPKMYIVGFNNDGVPLSPNQMFQDISPDYRAKTATIEKAPFLTDTTSVSIHPCKHATVMKVLMNRASAAARNKEITENISKLGIADNDDEEWEDLSHVPIDSGVRVDQYLVVFLKFISSVTPGIEHDYTMDAL